MKTPHIGYALLACSALFGLSLSTAASAADVTKLVESCASCHGKGGASTELDVPIIGGYSAEYLSGSLKAYKDKERPCKDTKIDMCQVVKDFSDNDIKQVAEYFAEQKFVRTPQKFDAVLARKGKAIHDKGCEKCHSEGGSVASDDAGILAGQKMAYLDEQLKFFNEGKRPIPKKMKPKLEALGKGDIEALIHYYGSFK
ncbi:MAG: c-type cytochrome [Gammaproteobacteria bacterium]|nr:c-type cytochrome [Gammaproteobacteria bacterium]